MHGFPGGTKGKESPAIQEIQVWALCQEDPLEKEMATHSRVLAWQVPWTEEPGRTISWSPKESDTTEPAHTLTRAWPYWLLTAPWRRGHVPECTIFLLLQGPRRWDAPGSFTRCDQATSQPLLKVSVRNSHEIHAVHFIVLWPSEEPSVMDSLRAKKKVVFLHASFY